MRLLREPFYTQFRKAIAGVIVALIVGINSIVVPAYARGGHGGHGHMGGGHGGGHQSSGGHRGGHHSSGGHRLGGGHHFDGGQHFGGNRHFGHQHHGLHNHRHNLHGHVHGIFGSGYYRPYLYCEDYCNPSSSYYDPARCYRYRC